jgi:precorrin-4/cobalt-precorrin-4 C11-methyltransferase
MTVHFIGAGPGAPDLLTLRGRDRIAGSPVCLYAGSLIPAAMLDHCPPGARIVNTAPLSLDEIIAFTITPGVPAFAAAAAALEVELTLPELAQSVVLTRTPGRASTMPPAETLIAFAATGATLAIHLSVHNLAQVIADLTPSYGADCPVAIVWRASWPDQQIARATLALIADAVTGKPDRTALILVGQALAAQDFAESSLYAQGYDRRFRPNSADSKFAGGVA